jgi:ribosomal protein S27AE
MFKGESGEGGDDYECGNCGYILAANMVDVQMENVGVECPNCGASTVFNIP